MSILDRLQPTPPTKAEMAANRMKKQTYQSFMGLVDAFNDGALLFWDNPEGLTPQEVADALGTDGQEIFQLHYKLGIFLSGIKPESVEAGFSLIGNFTFNQDGSIQVQE